MIVDEAFCDVRHELSLVSRLPDNAIVLRSFGKFFGLAGLRLGFAVSSRELASRISSMLGPWSVSGPALEIGRIALSNSEWIEQTRGWINQASRAQEKVLQRCAIEVTGNAGLFLEVRHKKAGELHNRLMRQHILVRQFATRPEHLRFGLCGDNPSLVRLERELNEILKGAMNA